MQNLPTGDDYHLVLQALQVYVLNGKLCHGLRVRSQRILV